jgi:nicotinamidase/pyrazinamidase
MDTDRTALIVVDIQNDFLPGGALAVPDGDAIIPGVRRLMEDPDLLLQVATQDWHPPGHVSFASSHEGREVMDVIELYGHDQIMWPDHCVQGTAGARLRDDLPWHRVTAIIRKATDAAVDSYSAFRNNWSPDGRREATGLAGYLRERGVERVLLCGLARDFCVKWSAEDAVAAGFDTTVVWDLTRGVDPSSDDTVRQGLAGAGVGLATLAEL